MNVLKFGGTSVANATNIKQTVSIFTQPQYAQSIVVVSALSGVTDLLIQTAVDASIMNGNFRNTLSHIHQKHISCATELIPTNNEAILLSIKQEIHILTQTCEGIYNLGELTNRTKDKVVSFGELLSSKIISAYLSYLNINHTWIDSRDVIKTDDNFSNAKVNFTETNEKIKDAILKGKQNATLFLAPGFIASNAKVQTTTLGRGGSDYTAAIFAGAINAENLEIWTDVSGMMTADPRWVKNVKHIPHTSYKEAMELSHFGAKVIYPPTIQPAMEKNIPIWIKNTFKPEDYGTKITSTTNDVSLGESDMITGISSINHLSLLSLEGGGMVGIPGFSKRLFEALASVQVNVILITQSSSEHSICVGINTVDEDKAKQAVDAAFEYEIAIKKVEPLQVERDLSIVAVVGDKMKNHQGISGKMFGALGRNGINVRAIAQGSSERNISAVIAYKDVKKSVNVLHEAFFEKAKKQLNVFVAGIGNVGKQLLQQLYQQKEYLLAHQNIELNVIGVANSKYVLIDTNGVDLNNYNEQLTLQPKQTVEDFAHQIIALNLPNSVFVDVSASDVVATVYSQLLKKSIAVVACNKIAASSSYPNYALLKNLSKEFNAPYLFETNVGAGLPVIDTLNNLVKSGDTILTIKAVLSGTLNYVFNNYNASKPFADVVRDAQNEGYTEPDPRLDLGGTDVMRKILILARESGFALEMTDITNNGFLPEECYKGTVEDFYASMLKNEDHFKQLYNDAQAKNCKLKFIASFENTALGAKGSVGLQHVSPDSDFYHLYGKDNIVLFYTQRYPEQPLVIKGAGAGANVTASGVFADIIRLV